MIEASQSSGTTLFEHPVAGPPYNRLRYLGSDYNGVHIYQACDANGRYLGDFGALNALKAAHRADPEASRCWYCEALDIKSTSPSLTFHCDHVVPTSEGGCDDLHNLVIACADHNSDKRDRSMTSFNEAAAAKWLRVLHDHLRRSQRACAQERWTVRP